MVRLSRNPSRSCRATLCSIEPTTSSATRRCALCSDVSANYVRGWRPGEPERRPPRSVRRAC
jgi:hypothetical protein